MRNSPFIPCHLDEVVTGIGGRSIGCGGLSIRMALFPTYWFRAAAIPKPPNV